MHLAGPHHLVLPSAPGPLSSSHALKMIVGHITEDTPLLVRIGEAGGNTLWSIGGHGDGFAPSLLRILLGSELKGDERKTSKTSHRSSDVRMEDTTRDRQGGKHNQTALVGRLRPGDCTV